MYIKQYNKTSKTSNLWNTVVMAVLVRHRVYHCITDLFYPSQERNHTKCTIMSLK